VHESCKALREATQAANHAREIYEIKLSARVKLAQQKEVAVQTLKSTAFNNALLKKLRAAKPQVANKLWAIVTGTISQTFSAIRGQASVVARGGEGFTVDGRSIGGLSGSTLDALGLAVRIALTKTFLPNTRFMLLDESSAACDATREQAMIATVASADFDQVIWATHSDAVESFAANVIQL
jgi:ABC-type transport system involved in cytochrome bd biosynthesis fused ATPase/permease subunit